jgi:hypothetical protein
LDSTSFSGDQNVHPHPIIVAVMKCYFPSYGCCNDLKFCFKAMSHELRTGSDNGS